MTYTTITNGYDWGPAIDKLILDLGTSIESKDINAESFLVWVKQSVNEVVTLNHSQRTVTKAFPSDAAGNPTDPSRYIALELEVGPTLANGSPFIYNRETGRNEFIQSNYEISLLPPLQHLFDNPVINSFQGDLKLLCDLFVHNQPFEQEGVSLTFAYYEPVVKVTKKPLIIWLHGAGEGGRDTTIAVLGNNVTNLIKDDFQAYFGDSGAYVLVPQVPTMWMDYNGQNVYNISVNDSDGHSFYTQALKGLIDAFLGEHPDIDTDRIYIGGCSNGGYMTVKMIIDYPDFFAAAFPTCSAYASRWLNKDRIEKIKTVPLWLVHAQNDPVVKISAFDLENHAPLFDNAGDFIPIDDFSNALFDRLINAGNPNVFYSCFDKVIDPSIKYTQADGQPYEYHGHWSWVYTLSNTCTKQIEGKTTSLFHWLANQSKQQS